MEIHIRATGSMIKPMDMEFILTQMERNILDNGKMINKMDGE